MRINDLGQIRLTRKKNTSNVVDYGLMY